MLSIKIGFWSLQQNSILLAIVREIVSLSMKNKCNNFYKIFLSFYFLFLCVSTRYIPKLKLLLHDLSIYVNILCLDSEPNKTSHVFDIFYLYLYPLKRCQEVFN